jgi:hypothetical protein
MIKRGKNFGCASPYVCVALGNSVLDGSTERICVLWKEKVCVPSVDLKRGRRKSK